MFKFKVMLLIRNNVQINWSGKQNPCFSLMGLGAKSKTWLAFFNTRN